MTLKHQLVCDTCQEDTDGETSVSICVDDGVYRHVDLRCLEKNISRWLSSIADERLRGEIIRRLVDPNEVQRYANLTPSLLVAPEIPEHLQQAVDGWLNSNAKTPEQVRWAPFPLGMVNNLRERVETAEAQPEMMRELRHQVLELREKLIPILDYLLSIPVPNG